MEGEEESGCGDQPIHWWVRSSLRLRAASLNEQQDRNEYQRPKTQSTRVAPMMAYHLRHTSGYARILRKHMRKPLCGCGGGLVGTGYRAGDERSPLLLCLKVAVDDDGNGHVQNHEHHDEKKRVVPDRSCNLKATGQFNDGHRQGQTCPDLKVQNDIAANVITQTSQAQINMSTLGKIETTRI